MSTVTQAKAAATFAAYWQGRGYEKGESQIFWTTLLNEVFGIEHPAEYITFEQQVHLDHTSFIDGYIRRTHVMIEQKSIEKDLGMPIKQSDGSVLNPFQQAKRYAAELPYSQRPRWIVTCNFREFWVYDMEQPNGEPQKILLENLGKEYYRLQFLVDEGNEHLRREMEVSVKAGELVGIIYDKLLEQYIDKDSPETHRSLNILCVRLVFCLYAEDAGLFASHTAFHDYLQKYGATDFRRTLIDLFALLDTPLKDRDPYLEDDIAAFPYVNGGLFSDEKIIIPRFTDELKQLILDKASADFDWSEISPTIFGAVFESTLNPETRRSGGMHYTSIENIHKVIDPLFLNDLRAEFEGILGTRSSSPATIRRLLLALQNKLASLTFFDPACGSGNFLTETFLSLRRLENEVIKAMYGDTRQLDFEGTIKVNISQFYGIEINDFACTVAKTALWIAENQMLQETSAIVGVNFNFLPLKTNAYIHEGNALRMDWVALFNSSTEKKSLSTENAEKTEKDSVLSDFSVDNTHFPDYIIGNPPFVGHQWRSKEQQEDMDIAFEGFDTYGKLDYVAAWYKKAADMMQGTKTQAAFVSTNSICQGESVAAMWKPLFEKRNIEITFAYPTFKWVSESNGMAAVHCVIIGFTAGTHSSPSTADDYKDTIGIPKGYNKKKVLFIDGKTPTYCDNINGYLSAAPNVFIQNRGSSLTEGMPKMSKGSQPTDGGNLILSVDEREEILKHYPEADEFIKPFIGAEEFINNRRRYCLWLLNVSPSKYHHITPILDRLRAVREMRLKSPTKSVQRDADTPMLFTQIRQPETNYLIVPRVSSENRRYIPIGYMSPDAICSDACQMIPDASLALFGILISNVHMAWMRAVCGRLEMRYRYSPAVYNNFPFPTPTEEQKAKIEQTAQAILDARAKYPDCSLAELYDELTMPPELRRAHQDNDRAVMQAYGLPIKTTESECVAHLFKLYEQLADNMV